MKLINSELSHRIIESHKIEIGELHFLKNIIITEFDEGIHLDIKTAKEYLELINAFYNSNKPFAIISNRIHSYSISPLDSDKFKNELKNLAAYGVVSYNKGKQDACKN